MHIGDRYADVSRSFKKIMLNQSFFVINFAIKILKTVFHGFNDSSKTYKPVVIKQVPPFSLRLSCLLYALLHKKKKQTKTEMVILPDYGLQHIFLNAYILSYLLKVTPPIKHLFLVPQHVFF